MHKSFAILILLLFFNCSSEKNLRVLNIAVSANFQFAIDEIIHEFEKNHQIKCNVIISSSGKLTAQISEGAPYDILISADLKYPNYLNDKKLTIREPSIYAVGKVVLWSIENSTHKNLYELNDSEVRHIAIANPETAPYGAAAKEILINSGLWDILQPKLVFGESISQTNQFITSEAADYGFTAKSVVLSKAMKGKGSWIEIEDTLYNPIRQGIVGLKTGNASVTDINKFINFMSTQTVKSILTNLGYSIEEHSHFE